MISADVLTLAAIVLALAVTAAHMAGIPHNNQLRNLADNTKGTGKP